MEDTSFKTQSRSDVQRTCDDQVFIFQILKTVSTSSNCKNDYVNHKQKALDKDFRISLVVSDYKSGLQKV